MVFLWFSCGFPVVLVSSHSWKDRMSWENHGFVQAELPSKCLDKFRDCGGGPGMVQFTMVSQWWIPEFQGKTMENYGKLRKHIDS